jgi:hypothetical protein
MESYGARTGAEPGVYAAPLGLASPSKYGMWAARSTSPCDRSPLKCGRVMTRGELGIDNSIRLGYADIVRRDRRHRRVGCRRSSSGRHRDSHSSWLDDLRNPVPVSREVCIIRPGS